ncbi:MAG: mevalonate kinase [Myxococcaceae bacterium]
MRRRPARPLKAFGPGKVILLGEHAVVYGTTALAVPLALGVRAEAVRAESCSLRLPSGLRGPRRQQLEEAFSLAADACGRPAVHLSLYSTLPMSMGLGSSAAVSVAVAGVLLQAATGKLPSASRLRAVAHGMEVLFHGTPSGVDDACSALGVPIRFSRRGASQAPLVRPLKLSRPFELLVALAGERQPTLDTVAGLRRRQAVWPLRYRRLYGCNTGERLLRYERNRCVCKKTGDRGERKELSEARHMFLCALGGEVVREYVNECGANAQTEHRDGNRDERKVIPHRHAEDARQQHFEHQRRERDEEDAGVRSLCWD